MNQGKVVSFISTKGGVGKSTLGVNLGALCADAGFNVLLVDNDSQPTTSSQFNLCFEAPAGNVELLAQRETRSERLVSRTIIPGLDIIVSNDRNDILPTMLRNAADGRLRLKMQLERLDRPYDLIIIDTPGTNSVLVEMAILASSIAISPINPETLSAREFRRGTVQMLDDLSPFEELGIRLPNIWAVLNKLDATLDARSVTAYLKETFAHDCRVRVLGTQIPNTVIFREAATRGLPAHRLEVNQPSNRKRPSLLQIMKGLASEVFPEWRDKIDAISPQDFKIADKKGGQS